jgi:hypothetical protein
MKSKQSIILISCIFMIWSFSLFAEAKSQKVSISKFQILKGAPSDEFQRYLFESILANLEKNKFEINIESNKSLDSSLSNSKNN